MRVRLCREVLAEPDAAIVMPEGRRVRRLPASDEGVQNAFGRPASLRMPFVVWRDLI